MTVQPVWVYKKLLVKIIFFYEFSSKQCAVTVGVSVCPETKLYHEGILSNKPVWFQRKLTSLKNRRGGGGCWNSLSIVFIFQNADSKRTNMWVMSEMWRLGECWNQDVRGWHDSRADGNNPTLALFIVSFEPAQLITHVHSLAHTSLSLLSPPAEIWLSLSLLALFLFVSPLFLCSVHD